MYNQAVMHPVPDALPCGHPRSEMNLRQWKRDTRCKLTAIWYILTNRSVIYNLYFDKEHPLTLAPRNMTPDTLVTRCEFDGVGVAPDDFHKAPGISERLEKCKMRKANDH